MKKYNMSILMFVSCLLASAAVYAEGVLEDPYKEELQRAAHESFGDAMYYKQVEAIQKNAEEHRAMARHQGRYFKMEVEDGEPTGAIMGQNIAIDPRNPEHLHRAYADINADAQRKIAQQKEALVQRQKQQEAKSKVAGKSDNKLADQVLSFKPYSYSFDVSGNATRPTMPEAMNSVEKQHQSLKNTIDDIFDQAKEKLKQGESAQVMIHDSSAHLGLRSVAVKSEAELDILRQREMDVAQKKYEQTVTELQRHEKSVAQVQDYYRRAKAALEKGEETALYPRAHGTIDRVFSLTQLHASAQEDLQQLQAKHKREMMQLSKQ